MRPIETLRNIGSKSARMLEQIGVVTIDDLQQLGCVNAYQKLQFCFADRISLNFLWAMYAGLQGRDWRDLTIQEKDKLKEQLAARREAP